MANGFDPRGTAVAIAILVGGALLAFLLFAPIATVRVKIDLPPARPAGAPGR